jgi:hypothetical protein
VGAEQPQPRATYRRRNVSSADPEAQRAEKLLNPLVPLLCERLPEPCIFFGLRQLLSYRTIATSMESRWRSHT